MKQVLALTRKELRGYFGSPMALIFVGAYLAATLFSFFWVDTFFARGTADVRPLFRWTPVLLIFLVAALTMRQWSEEQRSGTMEILLTLPVSTTQLVLGKFVAVVALVAVALALTLFLPITVALLGNLDWGPVFGGYLAALLLASAYAAIGLFVSSRTDNQIVALISTALLCGLFYLIGSPGVTGFFGQRVGEILKALGASSRFESIQRGVVDLRDLFYYLTLAGVFLTLNVLSLKAKGWSEGAHLLPRRRSVTLTSILVIANLLLVNVWAFPLRGWRVDLTQTREYTLSPATRELLAGLREPLLIRAYFSERTHPLLAPLVPLVHDMLREYEVAGAGRVRVEFIDPAREPEKEAEANQIYGIRPTPFQVADRYEAAVINSYFNILILYGDQSVTLGFNDLIEVEPQRDGTLDVRLRNLEYDLTSNIKKVAYGFQTLEAVLASYAEPVDLTVYITPNTLPEWLEETPAIIESVLQDIAARSNGKLRYTFVDPDAPDSPVSRSELFELYRLQPLAISLFAEESYYLYIVLATGDEIQVIYPSGELSEADVRNTVETALKRTSTGFLQVVGLWTPPTTPTQDMFGQVQQPLSSWEQVTRALRQEYEVRSVDLSSGVVPPDIDVLVLIGPQGMDERALYAIDQYLMRGGALILAAGNAGIMQSPFGGLAAQPVEGGVQPLLEHYGITVERSLVLDTRNEPFPVPVMRRVGDFQVQEIQALDYPFFVDVRPDSMARGDPIVSNLPAVTLNWVSPVQVDPISNAEREVVALLRSTEGAWTLEGYDIQPDFDLYPQFGFPQVGATSAYTLAVSVRGSFPSYFAGRPSPLEGDETAQAATFGTLYVSPPTARLVVIGSFEFVDDIVLELSRTLGGERYLNNLKLVQNAVAWAVEDLDLLDIRARGTMARVLIPLDERERSFWEVLNYVVALLALMGIGAVATMRQRGEEPMELLKLDRDGEPEPSGQRPSRDAGSEREEVS